MPTEKQLAANRGNATHSTGPRTDEGKARSARNALKHGFRSADFTIPIIDHPEEVANLKADLVSVYQPVNAQEMFALERAALAQHQILRSYRVETGMFTQGVDKAIDDAGRLMFSMSQAIDTKATKPHNGNVAMARGFCVFTDKSNTWSLLLRYQAQAERLYRRAIEDFDRLKKLRPELPHEDLTNVSNEPISDPLPEAKPATSPIDQTKPIPDPLGPPNPPKIPPTSSGSSSNNSGADLQVRAGSPDPAKPPASSVSPPIHRPPQ